MIADNHLSQHHPAESHQEEGHEQPPQQRLYHRQDLITFDDAEILRGLA